MARYWPDLVGRPLSAEVSQAPEMDGGLSVERGWPDLVGQGEAASPLDGGCRETDDLAAGLEAAVRDSIRTASMVRDVLMKH